MLSQDPYKTRTGGNAAILTRLDPIVYERAAKPAKRAGLSLAQREAYRDNGFIMLPELFSATEVNHLFAEMQAMRQAFAASSKDEVIAEPGSGEVRSIFNVHRLNQLFARLVRDPRVLEVARDILGDEVYIHQSRINYKPGFQGKDFYWHSDFETWHSEDGMPAMRAVSCSILLTDNNELNGPLLVMPGSHRHFISCVGETPEDHFRESLRKQEIGVPEEEFLRYLADMGGIVSCTGKAGSVVFFDCNTMHGSNSNISPYPRSNVFFVYNSISNRLEAPKGGLKPRPEYIAAREGIAPLEAEPLGIA